MTILSVSTTTKAREGVIAMDPVLMTLNIATMVILAVLIVLMHKWYKR